MRRPRGLSLLEVLFSFSLVLVMVLGYTYVSSLIGRTSRTGMVVRASNLAQAWIEATRKLEYSDPSLDPGTYTDDADVRAGGDLVVWIEVTEGVTLSNLNDDPPTAVTAGGVKRISVSVYRVDDLAADGKPLAQPVADGFQYLKSAEGI